MAVVISEFYSAAVADGPTCPVSSPVVVPAPRPVTLVWMIDD